MMTEQDKLMNLVEDLEGPGLELANVEAAELSLIRQASF